MNTRLMFVPPELATSSVSGLLEMKRPHGSEPTGMLIGEKPFAAAELCQTSSRLNAVFERNTLPRTASTAMSPIVPCCGSVIGATVDDVASSRSDAFVKSPSEVPRQPAPRSPSRPAWSTANAVMPSFLPCCDGGEAERNRGLDVRVEWRRQLDGVALNDGAGASRE